MKNIKTTLFITCIILLSTTFFSFKEIKNSHLIIDDNLEIAPRSGGVGAILGEDRTGSPISLGNCSSCHGASSTSTVVTISIKNATGATITQYTPGAVYTLELNVSGTSGTRRAVQGVVLTSTNAQAGTLSGATGISSIATVNGRQYLEHTGPATSTTNRIFSATWTAPVAGTGNVTVYSTGLAANNNGGTSGDFPSFPNSITIQEAVMDVFTTDIVSACDSYTWINGTTYTANNNTAKDTINLSGYDSIISLQLTINTSSTSTDTQASCGDFTWINGITYSSNNNTAKDTLINSLGCDSIVSLDLTVTAFSKAVTNTGNMITAIETGAVYQWLDCSNSFSPLAGETMQSFTATNSGNYAVEISKNGCLDTSACTNIVFTSIIENLTSTLKVSPNPFTESIRIEGFELQNKTIQLFDVTGKDYSKIITTNNNTIRTNLLPAGIYILNIEGKTTKLVKY